MCVCGVHWGKEARFLALLWGEGRPTVESRWTTQDVWAREGAFLLAARHTHLSLQHGFNHPDSETPSFEFGPRMLCFSC